MTGVLIIGLAVLAYLATGLMVSRLVVRHYDEGSLMDDLEDRDPNAVAGAFIFVILWPILAVVSLLWLMAATVRYVIIAESLRRKK